MKHNLLIAALAAGTLCAGAQSASSPAALMPGENTVSTVSGDNRAAYYRYSGPEDCLVRITLPAATYYATVSSEAECADTDIATSVVKDYENPRTEVTFAARADEDVYIKLSPLESGLVFTAAVEPRPYNDGLNPANPIQGSSAPQFVPMISGVDGVYVEYTPAEDGIAEVKLSCRESSLAVSADDERYDAIPMTDSSAAGWRVGHTEAKAGERLLFRFAGHSAGFATFTLTDAVPGESCELPATVNGTTATLPADIGTYYYSWTPQTDGMAEIDGGELRGGSAALMRSCNSTELTRTDGALLLRTHVTAGEPYIVKIERAQAAQQTSVFTIETTPVKDTDDFSTAPLIEADRQMTTPAFPGAYHYKIKAPSGEKCFLELSSSTSASNESTQVELLDGANRWNTLDIGRRSLRYAVTPGKEYVVKWTTAYPDVSIPFKVSFVTAQQGDLPDNPIEATQGRNDFSGTSAKYFSYTPQADGWMVLTTSAYTLVPQVSQIGDDGTYARLEANKRGESYRFDVKAGRKCLIEFSYVDGPSAFLLEEEPMKPGDSFADPLAVEGDKAMIPTDPGTTWLCYDVVKDGCLTVSTTMPFDYNYSETNSIDIYVNNLANAYQMPFDYVNLIYTPFSVNVKQGDKVYVKTVTISPALRPYYIEFSLGDNDRGVNYDDPIVIANTGSPLLYEFPVVRSESESRWFSLHLGEGTLSCSGPGNFTISLYAPGYDPAESPSAIVTSGYIDYDYGANKPIYGFDPIEIGQSGDYLLHLTGAPDRIVLVFKGTALSAGLGTDVVVADDGVSGAYRLNGSPAAEPLPPGIYIVRNGKTTKKIIVR